MKNHLLVAMLVLMSMTANATTPWIETCGSDVTQSGTYWPYANAFTGYDHQSECTYDGWNATVRKIDRYAANGPHIYLASSKDCRFSIAGLAGGANVTLSFDIVCYDRNQTAGTYENTDLIGLKVNEEVVSIPYQTISSSAFVTVSFPISLANESNKIEWTKASSVVPEVRLDNFTLIYDEVVQTYTLTISAGVGGTVNSDVNGEYVQGTEVTITATPDDEYMFVQWSDGNTEPTRTITMTEDIVLRAQFRPTFNTVADIIAIYNDLNLAQGAKSTETYTARGYVTYWKNGYPTYQNGDFFVDDEASGSTTLLECFRLVAQNTSDKRALEVGEYVEFTGKLQNYYDRAEICDGTYRVLEAPQQPETPSDCYSEFEGMTGAQILATLHEAIKDPDTVTYRNLRADLTGIDYRADGTVWDMYSPCSFTARGYCGVAESLPECECYNREHMLPQSWWANDNTQRMRTDLHHVIPADAFTNEKRSNNPYGEVSGTPDWSNTAGSKLGSGTYNTVVFEPADEYKGDIARVYFYMLTCYSDKDFTQHWKGQKVFTFTNGKAGLTATAKALFLKWHRNDPVSTKEINRNAGVERLQHNRNPFVDKPELIEYIWGSKASEVYTCTQTDLEKMEKVEKTELQATKVLENGALFIVMPDGTRYNVMGIRSK